MADPRALSPMPDFPSFYRAVHAREPFPWQARLARQVAASEEWPAVSVPTGMGKTACLDIAVWWLASQAGRAPRERTAPTRIWWVVDRRILVDSTLAHAEALAAVLDDPAGPGRAGEGAEILETTADRLRSLSADPDPTGKPLEVIRLRGGVSSDRATDPSRPAVLLSTVPMYGSRLLFRAYGSSRALRPVDAALAGTDSLVLLDEAHLAPSLDILLDDLQDCWPDARSILGETRSRPVVVPLTATGTADATFVLDARDDANPLVRQRLDANKPLELRKETGSPGHRLAEAMRDLLDDAPAASSGMVFANNPETARGAFRHLRKLFPARSAEVVLLTGRTREHEAERIHARVLDPGTGFLAAGGGTTRDRHLIVVCTQTLEVGADLDAGYLVTEACSVRALTQRLGRLNRLGKNPRARGIYVHIPPNRSSRGEGWPIHGLEPESVWERLSSEAGETATVDVSPRRLASVLGPPRDTPERAPEILPGILWEWIKTTTPPEGEAPFEPYLSGIGGPRYSVTVLWRAHVPAPEEFLWPRPSDREAVEVPIGEARQVLEVRADLCRLRPDGATAETLVSSDLRPGDVVILPCDQGLLDEFGWNPRSTDPVLDVSLVDRGLPLEPVAIRRLCGAVLATQLIDTACGAAADGAEISPADRARATARIREELASARAPAWNRHEWTEFIASLEDEVLQPRNEVARLPAREPSPERPDDERDEWSLQSRSISLDLHGREVAARARRIADLIGVPGDVATVLEDGALLHDIGKADRRFQRWLDPGGEHPDAPLARSNLARHEWGQARAAARWPSGGRHEALSARLVQRWLNQDPAPRDPWVEDLLLHLVISHHGKGRPLVSAVEDTTETMVVGIVHGATVEAPANLSFVDWDQPSRFRRLNTRFGPWGLALLEAIVRQADHQVFRGGEPRIRRNRCTP